jgi:hypothetical protein
MDGPHRRRPCKKPMRDRLKQGPSRGLRSHDREFCNQIATDAKHPSAFLGVSKKTGSIKEFWEVPPSPGWVFTQKRFYTMRKGRSHLGRDREITEASQEILSARDET